MMTIQWITQAMAAAQFAAAAGALASTTTIQLMRPALAVVVPMLVALASMMMIRWIIPAMAAAAVKPPR
jgi:hypothetical protein